jgi:pantetheine-phosphate adenylyltransferase
MNKAIFPGSFDPFTIGHEDIVRRALPLFQEIIIAIGVNTTKQYLFDLNKRKTLIEAVFAGEAKIKVMTYEGLTVNFAAQQKCNFILRGLRNSIDFEYEKSIAEMNKKMNPAIETIFLNCAAEYASISSTIVREIIKSGGDAKIFFPSNAKQFLTK